MTKTRSIELALSRQVEHYHSVQVLQQRDPTQPQPQLCCKRQIGHRHRSQRNPLGRSMALLEQQAYSHALSNPCGAIGS